jgi:hypothetical protein
VHSAFEQDRPFDVASVLDIDDVVTKSHAVDQSHRCDKNQSQAVFHEDWIHDILLIMDMDNVDEK